MSSNRYESWKSIKTTKTWYYPPGPRKPTPPSMPGVPPRSPPLPPRSPPYFDGSASSAPRSPSSSINLDIGQPVSRVSIEYAKEPEQKRPDGISSGGSQYGKASERRRKPSPSPSPRTRVSQRRPRSPSPSSSCSRSSRSSSDDDWGRKNPSSPSFAFGAFTTALTLGNARHPRSSSSNSPGRKERRGPRQPERRARSRDGGRPDHDVFMGNDGHRYVRAD